MRSAKLLTLGLMLALAAAGCAPAGADDTGVATAQSAGTTPKASPSAPAKPDQDLALKHAQCMRKQGLTWWPDPQPGGRTTIKTPKGFNPETMEKAQEACKQFAPDGGAPPAPDP